MADEKFETILSISILPAVIDLIVTKDKMDEVSATQKFYKSKTFELLSREETKVWHFSPTMIYEILKSEDLTGEPILPEET